MSCKVELSRKDPQDLEGFSSKLNEEFLKIFNDPVEGTNTSQKYLEYKGRLQNFYGEELFKTENLTEEDVKVKEIILDDYKDKGLLNTSFYEDTGEPKLHSSVNGGHYFLNDDSSNNRLWVNQDIMTESQRVNLIRALTFSIIEDNQNLNTEYFVKKFFRNKTKSNNAAIDALMDSIEDDTSDEKIDSILDQVSILKSQNNLINRILNSNILLESIYVGINQELRGVQLQYDQDLIKDEMILEDKDVSMGIDNYVLESSQVRDDVTIDPEIFKIMSTIPDTRTTLSGEVIVNTEPLFGMAMSRPVNEVKNRVLDVVNNLIETELEGQDDFKDVYEVMMEALQNHYQNYNDPVIKAFVSEITKVYNSKSENDKLAFKVKFFKSFNKGVNNFILTEITKEKEEDSYAVSKIILKLVNPDDTQNKRSIITQEFINALVYTNSIEENIKALNKKMTGSLAQVFTMQEIADILRILNLNLNENAIRLLFTHQDNMRFFGDRMGNRTLKEILYEILHPKATQIMYDRTNQLKANTTQAIKMIRTKKALRSERNRYGQLETFEIEMTAKEERELKLMLQSTVLNSPLSILANAEAFSRQTLSDSNYNIAGKSRWKYSNQSGINKQILTWQSGNKKDLIALKHKNLPYVDHLLAKDWEGNVNHTDKDVKEESDRRIAKLRLITNAQVREVGGDNAFEHKEILESDLMFDQMVKLQNLSSTEWDRIGELGDVSGDYWKDIEKTIATYNYSADKGSSYGFKGFDKIIGTIGSNESFIEMFKGEIFTMQKHSKIIHDLNDLLPIEYNEDGSMVESRLKERNDYILQKLVPGFHYKTKLKEEYTEDGVTKERVIEFNPEELESETNVFHPELINNAEWAKFGFFNAFLQGNEQLFDTIFTLQNGIKYIENAQVAIELVTARHPKLGISIEDVIVQGIENLAEEGYLYYSEQTNNNNVTNILTNIEHSQRESSIKEFIRISLANNMQMFQMFNGDLGFFKQTREVLSMEDALKRGPGSNADGLQLLDTNANESSIVPKSTQKTATFKSANGVDVEYNPSRNAVIAVVSNAEFDTSKFDAHFEKVLSHREDKRLLKPLYKAYKHEIADAGAYMTLEHYKTIKSKAYSWTEHDEEMFNDLLDPDLVPQKEHLKWLRKAGNTAQPVKLVGYQKIPVYDTEGNLMYEMPVYLKYAPTVLVPSLIKGTDVELLMNAMENQGVDQVVFKSGSKASNPGLTTIHNGQNGMFDGLNPDMVLNPFTFSYSSLKWQVELPTHFDSENTIGNQHVKNLLANLDLEDSRRVFPYRGEMLSSKEMYDRYSGAINNILKRQSQNFLNRYGITFDDNNNIKYDNPKLRELLLSQLDANSDYQLISIMKDETIPLETIPGIAQRMFPILAGFVHKKVGKIRTNTGSVIQVANIGFDRWDGNENDVVYLSNDVELKPPLPISILDLKPKELVNLQDLSDKQRTAAEEYRKLSVKKKPTKGDLDRINQLKDEFSTVSVYYYTVENKRLLASTKPELTLDGVKTKGVMKIKEAKVMMPFSSIKNKLNMSYAEFKKAIEESKPLWGTENEHKAPIPQELFNNIISYRIPNQAISSNDAMEIVGILPDYAGDQAYVYHEITAKTGSDFDVDKLYLMLPSFDIGIGQVVDHLYNNYIKKNHLPVPEGVANIVQMLNQIDPENDITYDEVYKEIVEYIDRTTNGEKYEGESKNALEKAIGEIILNRDGEVDNALIDSFLDSDVLNSKEIKYPSDNSMKGLQNTLIELMGSILKSEATYDDLMSQLDSDILRDGIREVQYEMYLAEKGVDINRKKKATAQQSKGDNLPTSKETINIYAGTNENAELSNFAIRSFTTNVETPSGDKKIKFQSVEQGFHYYKAMIADRMDIAEKALKTTNGGQLKRLTNRSNLKMTPKQVKEWDSTSKNIMLDLMYDSYDQNPKAAEKLLATGNAKITHTQDNTRWKTDFPEVTMIVRDRLKEENSTNDATESSDNIDSDSDVMTFEQFVESMQLSAMSQLSPVHMIKNRVDMLKAKKLVATMANHMTHVPISQIQKLRFFHDLGLGSGDFGKIFMDDYDGYLHVEDSKLDDYNNYNLKLTQVVSYFMNAAVDAAKDNYIIEGNFNSYTSGAAMLLVRSGMNAKEIFELLLNPTIMQISKVKQAQTEITSLVSLKNEIPGLPIDTKSLNNYSIQYLQWLKENTKFKGNTSVSDIISALENNDNSEKLIAGLWNLLVEAGKELSNSIGTSKSDSSGAGKNLASFSTLLGNLERESHSNIGRLDEVGNPLTLLAIFKDGIPQGSMVPMEFIKPNDSSLNRLTFLGMMQNNSLLLVKKLSEGQFVEATPGYQFMLKHILKLQGRPMEFSEDTVSDLSKSLYPVVLAQTNHELYNIHPNEVDLTIENTIKWYNAVKNRPEFRDNAFIKQLMVNPMTGALEFPNTKKFNKPDEAVIREGFYDLYTSRVQAVRNFSILLIKHAYLTSGFKTKNNTYNQFLPISYFIETGHSQSIKDLIDMLNDPNNEALWTNIAEAALVQKVVNNPRDYRNVKVLYRDHSVEFGKAVQDRDTVAHLKDDSGVFAPFVFKSQRTDEKNDKGGYKYSNHLGILSNVSEDLNYPVYTELKLSGFDNDGIEKREKYLNPRLFKEFLYYKGYNSNFFDKYNLTKAYQKMENGSSEMRDYFNYDNPISKMMRTVNSDNTNSVIKNEIYKKILPLMKHLGNSYNQDGVMELINIGLKEYKMTEQELLDRFERSDDSEIIEDLQNIENCYIS